MKVFVFTILHLLVFCLAVDVSYIHSPPTAMQMFCLNIDSSCHFPTAAAEEALAEDVLVKVGMRAAGGQAQYPQQIVLVTTTAEKGFFFFK